MSEFFNPEDMIRMQADKGGAGSGGGGKEKEDNRSPKEKIEEVLLNTYFDTWSDPSEFQSFISEMIPLLNELESTDEASLQEIIENLTGQFVDEIEISELEDSDKKKVKTWFKSRFVRKFASEDKRNNLINILDGNTDSSITPPSTPINSTSPSTTPTSSGSGGGLRNPSRLANPGSGSDEREKAWKKLTDTEEAYQSVSVKDYFKVIERVSDNEGDWKQWKIKLDIYDAFGAGLSGGDNDAARELTFGNINGARERIAKEKLSMEATREFLESPEGEAINLAVNFLEKIFMGGEITCQYDNHSNSGIRTGLTFKHDYTSFGNPDSNVENALDIKSLLSGLTQNSSEYKNLRITTSTGEVINPDLSKDLLDSDISTAVHLMFIYELRGAAESAIYGRYISSPKPSFDMQSIIDAAPMSYVMYKSLGGSLIRPKYYDLWFTQRLPSEKGRAHNTQNNIKSSNVPSVKTGEVLHEKFRGLKTRGQGTFVDNLEVREEAIDAITPVDLLELAERVKRYPYPAEKIIRDDHGNIIDRKPLDQSFTTEVNDSYQTLPFLWDVFRAKGNDQEKKMRGLTYKQYDEGCKSFASFLQKINSFPKGESLPREKVEELLGKVVTDTSSMKGFEATLQGTEFYGIFIGTLTMMLVLYIKYLYDAYDDSTSGPRAVKRTMFKNTCLNYLNKQRSETFMDPVRLRLIEFIKHSNSGLEFDFLSGIQKVATVKYEGVNFPVPRKLKGSLDSRYRTFLRNPSPEELKDTDGG